MTLRIAALSCLLFAVPALALGDVAAPPQSLNNKQIGAIRALIRRVMAEQQAPGATFAVGLGDKTVWTQGFGLADVENNLAATPDTVYRTASIGKSMTATAAMAQMMCWICMAIGLPGVSG